MPTPLGPPAMGSVAENLSEQRQLDCRFSYFHLKKELIDEEWRTPSVCLAGWCSVLLSCLYNKKCWRKHIRMSFADDSNSATQMLMVSISARMAELREPAEIEKMRGQRPAGFCRKAFKGFSSKLAALASS